MPKIIQPLNDPDEIRHEAEDQVKEKFADYYVDGPAPDPLTWQAPTPPVDALDDSQDLTVADLTAMNDPLNYQPPVPSEAQTERYEEIQAAKLSQQNDPLKDIE
jgi:hypothetical protein